MISPQENSVGVEIVVSVLDESGDPLDLSSASTKNLIFKKPDGTVVTKAGSIANPPGTDGKLKYTTEQGDLTPYGDWEVQAYIVKPGVDSRGTVGYFTVLRNL